MNPYDTPAGQLLSDLNDFLAGLETVLRAASIDQRIAIDDAAKVVYNERNEPDPYNRIITDIARLRGRVYDHLEN